MSCSLAGAGVVSGHGDVGVQDIEAADVQPGPPAADAVYNARHGAAEVNRRGDARLSHLPVADSAVASLPAHGNVDVGVDESGEDPLAGNVNPVVGVRWRKLRLNCGDVTAVNPHVHRGVEVVGRVQHPPTVDDPVVMRHSVLPDGHSEVGQEQVSPP